MRDYDTLQRDLDDARMIVLRLSQEFTVPAHQNPFRPAYDAIAFAIAYFRSNEDDMRDALGEFDGDMDDDVEPEKEEWCDFGNHYVREVWMDVNEGLVCAVHLTDLART